MKNMILSAAVITTLLLLAGRSSEAGDVRLTFGNAGQHHHDHGYNDGYGFRGGRGLRQAQLRQPRLRHIGAPVHSTPYWHDTTHLHWHPGGWEWCDGRLFYVPGHYDVHRTGHFHH